MYRTSQCNLRALARPLPVIMRCGYSDSRNSGNADSCKLDTDSSGNEGSGLAMALSTRPAHARDLPRELWIVQHSSLGPFWGSGSGLEEKFLNVNASGLGLGLRLGLGTSRMPPRW